MLSIGEIPAGLQSFFGVCRAEGGLSKPQYEHFWPLVLAFAVTLGSRNVSRLYACLQSETCRQKVNDFLTESPWDGTRVLTAACLFALALLKLKDGEELQILLDGTQKLKRGKKIEALGKVKDATHKYPAPGHRYLLVYLRVRGIMLPWRVSLYLPKKWLATPEGQAHCRATGAGFKTLNQLAVEAIQALPPDWKKRYRVTVLMDSGFCNKVVCPAIRAAGFHFVTVAQMSRKLTKVKKNGQPGKTVKLSAYARGRVKYQGQNVTLPAQRSGGKPRHFRVAEDLGLLKGLGLVKCVYSRRQSDGNLLVIVASDTTRSAREIALAYGLRWGIEVTIKGLKGRLGLGTYPQRYIEGAVHHLHLSLLAQLALIVAELQGAGSKTYCTKHAPQFPSLRQLQDSLRAKVWRRLLSQLRDSRSAPRVLKYMERALAA